MTDEHAQPTVPAPPVRQTDKLAEALAAAQGEYRPVKRTKTVIVKIKPEKGGGTYSFKYAPLDECIAATRPALSKHGLAVVQVFHADPLRIVTTLLHDSGQFVVSTLPLRGGGTPQELGTEITYMRRYEYSAIVNIAADEDTDGPPPPDASSYEHKQTEPRQQSAPSSTPPGTADKGQGPSKAQLKRLFAISKEHGWTTEELKGELLVRYKVEHSTDLTKAQYDELCGNARTKTKGLLETLKAAKDETPPSAETTQEKDDHADHVCTGEPPSLSPPEDPGTEAGGQVDETVFHEWGHKIFDAKQAGEDLEALRGQIRSAEGVTAEQRAKLYKYLDEEKPK